MELKSVMVDFMCLLDWVIECPDIWLDIISGCACECVLDEISI